MQEGRPRLDSLCVIMRPPVRKPEPLERDARQSAAAPNAPVVLPGSGRPVAAALRGAAHRRPDRGRTAGRRAHRGGRHGRQPGGGRHARVRGLGSTSAAICCCRPPPSRTPTPTRPCRPTPRGRSRTSPEDVQRRATEAALLQLGHGATAVRAHVRVGDVQGLGALEAVLQARRALRGLAELTTVAMPRVLTGVAGRGRAGDAAGRGEDGRLGGGRLPGPRPGSDGVRGGGPGGRLRARLPGRPAHGRRRSGPAGPARGDGGRTAPRRDPRPVRRPRAAARRGGLPGRRPARGGRGGGGVPAAGRLRRRRPSGQRLRYGCCGRPGCGWPPGAGHCGTCRTRWGAATRWRRRSCWPRARHCARGRVRRGERGRRGRRSGCPRCGWRRVSRPSCSRCAGTGWPGRCPWRTAGSWCTGGAWWRGPARYGSTAVGGAAELGLPRQGRGAASSSWCPCRASGRRWRGRSCGGGGVRAYGRRHAHCHRWWSWSDRAAAGAAARRAR